jgi:hypothetical protein
MKKSLIFTLTILLSVFSVNSLFAETSDVPDFNPGIYQTIVDGKDGEGGLFFRFDFDKDGTVTINKQMGGRDELEETKRWELVGDSIKIISQKGDEIQDFDGFTIKVKADNTLEYKKGVYNGVIKDYKQIPAFIHWILILVVLILLNEIFRRSKHATIFFFLLLPLVLTPLVWAQNDISHWFKWVKVYSVVTAVLWFTMIRYTKMHNYNWVKLIAALFLAVNIAEAVSQDFSMGYLPNILNGIAGILNIITLFYAWKQIGPDKSKYKDMVWPGMTVFWIIAYDIWNIVYVYLNFPGSTSAQLMVILSCTIPALFIKRGTWLQARAFTLAVWFMYYFTFPRFTEQMELMFPRSYNLMLIVAIISIAANFIYFLIWIKKVRQRKSIA